MTTSATSSETSILSHLATLRSPTEFQLVRRAVWLVALPFLLTLGLDLLAVLFLGVPPGKSRFFLAGLFDLIYQTFMLTLVITAWLMRVFFQTVRETFESLAEQEVISEKEPGQALAFVQTYQRWLYAPARLLLGAAFAILGLAVDYYLIFGEDLARLAPGHEPAAIGQYANIVWLTNWINALGFLAALFMIGSLIFRMFVTAAFIYRAPAFFEFQIQLSHPDQCGGFKAIGDLCLKMVYVLLALALFASFWLIVSKHVTLSPDWQELLPPYVLSVGFRSPVKMLLVLLAVSGVGIFFWPMYTVHTLMLAERARLKKTLNSLARRIHQLDGLTLTNPSAMPTAERRKILDEIDSLKELYLRTNKAPAWPFDRSVALKFASTQVIPVISLLGLGGPMGQLIEIVTKLFQGG